jgi:hypothetical protein
MLEKVGIHYYYSKNRNHEDCVLYRLGLGVPGHILYHSKPIFSSFVILIIMGAPISKPARGRHHDLSLVTASYGHGCNL